jgi:hypothetical protein
MSTIKADNFTWKSGEATGQPSFTVSADKVIYGTVKTWLNFVGTSGSVNASYNISSVTRNGTGDYTPALTNAVYDNKFAVTGATSAEGAYNNVTLFSSTTNTTSTIRIYTADYNSPTKCDQTSVYAVISR